MNIDRLHGIADRIGDANHPHAHAAAHALHDAADEIDRLRRAIERHRDEAYAGAGSPPLIEDWESDLWSVLDEP